MDTTPRATVTAAYDQGQIPSIACVNRSSVALGVDWAPLVAALDAYANTVFAPVWGTPAKLIDAGTGPNIPSGCWGMVFLDDADQPGALGYHDLTPEGLPLSKIFVRTTLADGDKVSVTASHELAEMLVDPGIQMGAVGPDGQTWYAYETADAVERDELEVNGIAMSDFVYPAWFEGFRAPGSTRFDHLGLLHAAFELRQGGYIGVFRNGNWTQQFGSDAARQRFQLHKHPRAHARARVMRHHSAPNPA
ncbi:MAG TPA: hypothetical protein VME92_14795 [Acetobacteraceae bacterium]|nr:hypothetical protein [Acetobacteraceae bacterium]